MANSSEGRQLIILNSPVGSKPVTYEWPLTYVSKGQKIDGAEEIIETIRWVAREYIEFKPAIENLLPGRPDLKSYECIKGLCDKYNKITKDVMKMNMGTSVALKTSSRASQGLLKHIIQQVYNYAVVEPNELNKYSPFSSETYGETSFEFMAQLIDRNQFRPKEQDIFVDLGSGVGHIVLQMAASVKCKKCYGIEIADVPAGYAKLMEERFKFWMNWHGKTYTEFELFHGDFFERQYSDIIKGANYILVNNFAFKPDVDHKLKQRFLDLKDGTQILSSKPFCSLKSRVNERNLTDIGSIMHVVEVKPDLKNNTVSWTPKPLSYYLHVLDGSRVERYYEKQKRRQGKSEKGRPSKKRRINKAGSESGSENSDDNTVYGPTTRKAWSEWCNASSNCNNRNSTDSAKISRNNSTDTENLDDEAILEDTAIKTKGFESHRKDRKIDAHSTADRQTPATQETSAQNKNNQNIGQAPKSCLDKKRDYAIKKSGTSSIQNAPPSALYSITKNPESSNGSSSSQKIPNIVIKVKPSSEVKLPNSNSGQLIAKSVNSSSQGVTVADENVKKLRQRKKSTTTQQISTDTKATSRPATQKLEAKAAGGPVEETVTETTTPSKQRKSVSLKATVKATAPSKKKVPQVEKTSSLDLLHAKTVESVSKGPASYNQPAPGCEDYQLGSIVQTPSLPKVVVKDMSMLVSTILSSKNFDKFIASTKQEFERFAMRLQKPSLREQLLTSVEMERLKHRDLRRAEEELSRHIRVLGDRIPRAMKSHCDDYGIKNTPRSVVLHLGSMLKKHQDLLSYVTQLESVAVQANQRIMNPPAAHSNNNQCLSSPYRLSSTSATLDLSLKSAESK